MQDSRGNVKLFMNIGIGSKPAGTIIFRMFNNICPKTCKNFIKLCCKTAGFSKATGKALCYKGSSIHKVIPGFIIQGGDFTCNNGTGGESIYEKKFEDENFKISHDKPGLLTMANSGPNSNTSQFIITCQPCKWLDGKNVVFGEVIEGFEVCAQIQKVRTNSRDQPLTKIIIKDCGEIIATRKSRISSSSSRKRSKANLKKNRKSTSRNKSRSRSKSRNRSKSRIQRTNKSRSRSRSHGKSNSKYKEKNIERKSYKSFHNSNKSYSSSSVELSKKSQGCKKEVYYKKNRDKDKKSSQNMSDRGSSSISDSRLRSYSRSLSRSLSYSKDSYRSDSR